MLLKHFLQEKSFDFSFLLLYNIYYNKQDNNTPYKEQEMICLIKKRVWCLYRVSTEKQVKEDDIPVQRNACRTFVETKANWEITNELYEKGVSGWKNKTEDRDKLLEIKKGAVSGEFDILLVFMFDRLGRREDETPLVANFLHEHKIEVYSVNEGKMNFDEHIDKLLNYIRFWQSSGESLKTSIRVSEAIRQINEDGGYVGGNHPIGYKLIDSDEYDKKRMKYKKKLIIDEHEANIVRLIYNLVIEYDYGYTRIDKYLHEHGYKQSNGNRIRTWTIRHILNNPIYIGYKRYAIEDRNKKEWKLQPFNEELKIIDDTVFYKARKIIELRKNKYERDKEKIKKVNNGYLATSSDFLFGGILKCGYCGSKMYAKHKYYKYDKVNGETSKYRYGIYTCYEHNGRGFKHEVKTVRSNKIEPKIEKYILDVIRNIDTERFAKNIEEVKENSLNNKRDELMNAKKNIVNKNKQLEKLNNEIALSLLGESEFTPSMLKTAITNIEKDIKEFENVALKINKEIETIESEIESATEIISSFDKWEERYKSASIEAKKTMIARIVKDIIYKKNEITINFALNLNDVVNFRASNISSTRRNGHALDPKNNTNLIDDIKNEINVYNLKEDINTTEFSVKKEI